MLARREAGGEGGPDAEGGITDEGTFLWKAEDVGNLVTKRKLRAAG